MVANGDGVFVAPRIKSGVFVTTLLYLFFLRSLFIWYYI